MRSTALRRDERGIALPTAIFALVVIGALVAGIFFTARIEVRSGENTMSNARATEAAQAGLMMGYPQVLTIAGSTLPIGNQAGVGKTQIGTTGSYYTDTVTKLNRYMYLLRSFGTYEVGGNVIAARTMAMLVKKYVPELLVNSGAIVAGSVTVQGSVNLNGADAVPPNWTGCTPGATQPAIRSDSVVTVTGGGPTISPGISSNDTTVPNMTRVLDTLFMQLAAQRTIYYNTDPGSTAPADSVIAGVSKCNTALSSNWGDLRHTSTTHCDSYYPIIYLDAGGPGHQIGLHGGSGQGILLVNGDLKMNGNYQFDGLILVRGSYLTGGGTMNLTGSMISSLVDTDPNRGGGGKAKKGLRGTGALFLVRGGGKGCSIDAIFSTFPEPRR
ncbi:MAG: hypothetical protein JF590_04550 [Gemmatimonadetes bacterium]|nr:hypothetical protein [Gemmatimonadota bacterium]